MPNSKRGFTLVELLVVITIIAVLSMIGITLYSSAQKSARDARRKADVDAISKALEANYNNTTCGADTSNPYCTVDASLFVGGIPTNPNPGGSAYTRNFPTGEGAVRNSYVVCALLENKNGNGIPNDPPCSSTACDFTVASGNTATHYCSKNQQ